MSGRIEVLSAGPGVTIQDRGRRGYLRYGLTAGGAMDSYALVEGAALLGNDLDAAALEIFQFGGRFRALDGPLIFTLTGAPMRASINGASVRWRITQRLAQDEVLDIGGSLGAGSYGYLHLCGGIDAPLVLGSRATHLRAKIGGIFGRALQAGDVINTFPKSEPPVGLVLPDPNYLGTRIIRVNKGAQAYLFDQKQFAHFTETSFSISNRRDRMGIRLESDGPPFTTDAGLTVISDAVVAGDVQVPGDGIPTVLMADRPPTGGYPRIATVISADLCALAQLPNGARFQFKLTDEAAALSALRLHRHAIATLPSQVHPLVRDSSTIKDLLSYELISGPITD